MQTRRLVHLLPLRPRAGPQRGFTLVELLASMGIIVFVLSIAILALGPALRGAEAKNAAQRLRATLDGARVRAIQQRRAVRFEAQQAGVDAANLAVPEQWGGNSNAGDVASEWTHLPEFVTVDFKTGGGSWDPSVTAFSITFASDATVKAVSKSTGNGAGKSTTSYTDPTSSELTSPMYIRLYTVREAPDDEVNKGACFIEITPLTGVFSSYGYEEYKEDGSGKIKAGDLPRP